MADFNVRYVRKDMKDRAGQEFRKMARALRPVLEEYTPVRTGKLKAGWELTVDEAVPEIVIRNERPYWIFVEMGTSRMDARAPARRALAAFAGSSSGLGGGFGGAVRRVAGGLRRIFRR